MTLSEQVNADLIAAMKAKDEVVKDTLRMLKAAIMKWETDGEKKTADDAAVLQLIQKEVKGRKDAADAFTKSGNMEMANKELAEMEILKKYLPEQLDEETVRKIITETLSESGVASKSEIGKAMGLLMPKLKGKADGGLINRIVSEILA